MELLMSRETLIIKVMGPGMHAVKNTQCYQSLELLLGSSPKLLLSTWITENPNECICIH